MVGLMQDSAAERRKVHILMSIAESDISKILTLIIQKEFGSKYDLSIIEIPREAKKGLWVDPAPIPPWEWRKGKGSPEGSLSGRSSTRTIAD